MSKQEEIVGKGISEAIGGKMAEEKEAPKKLSRKDFVKGAAVVAGAGALASCAPAATPAPEAAPTCPPAEECPTAVPGEAGPVTLELFDPTGAFEVTGLHAPRLDTLEGKTICMLSNYGWEADRTLPYIQDLLQEQFPTANFIPDVEVTPSRAELENLKYLAPKLEELGCDAVIIGNAG